MKHPPSEELDPAPRLVKNPLPPPRGARARVRTGRGARADGIMSEREEVGPYRTVLRCTLEVDTDH